MGTIISILYILFTGFPGTTVENGNKYATNQSVRCPDWTTEEKHQAFRISGTGNRGSTR